MNVLGIRCSNTDYSVAVLSGTRNTPQVIHCDTILYPTGFSKPQSLNWMLQEIDAVVKKHCIARIVMKGFEGRNRDKTFVERIEREAMVSLAAFQCGVKAVFKKISSTIAKDLGLKGRARYLTTSLDTSSIPGYSSYTDRQKDAIVAAWSKLP